MDPDCNGQVFWVVFQHAWKAAFHNAHWVKAFNSISCRMYHRMRRATVQQSLKLFHDLS